MRTLGYLGAAVALVLAMTTEAMAGSVVAVPEINPASLASGLALLAGGVMLLRARSRR